MIRFLATAIKVVWASPNTMLGLFVGLPNLLTGGKTRFRKGAIEFAGGGLTKAFSSLPRSNIAAMTLGHVILGISFDALDRVTNHERVHVAQYTRWGPFFLPAYGFSSLVAWMQGKDAYLENVFEIEAYKVKG